MPTLGMLPLKRYNYREYLWRLSGKFTPCIPSPEHVNVLLCVGITIQHWVRESWTQDIHRPWHTQLIKIKIYFEIKMINLAFLPSAENVSVPGRLKWVCDSETRLKLLETKFMDRFSHFYNCVHDLRISFHGSSQERKHEHIPTCAYVCGYICLLIRKYRLNVPLHLLSSMVVFMLTASI